MKFKRLFKKLDISYTCLKDFSSKYRVYILKGFKSHIKKKIFF